MIPKWFQLVLMSVVPTVYTQKHKMCSMQDIPELLDNGRVTESIIKSLNTSGPMSCARVCLLWTLCHSFSFGLATGLCELSSLDGIGPNIGHQSGCVASNISAWPSIHAGTCAEHTCPPNAICNPQPQPTCDIIGCLTSEKPVMSHAALSTDVTDVICPVGTILKYDCNPNFVTSAEITCEADGSWNSTVCRLAVPTSCLEVKQCQPVLERADGEYWMRLPNFDFYRTRIYCHNMTSNEPKTFLTLPNTNHGSVPSVSNRNCGDADGQLSTRCSGIDGYASYNKIKINLETMTVNEKDYTFAHFSNAELRYGRAYDCYSVHTDNVLNSCRTRGRFTIDLSGTGWIVHPDQTWRLVGWSSAIESITRRANGTVVELKCGGWSGGCRPDGKLTLVPHPWETPTEQSAHHVRCT